MTTRLAARLLLGVGLLTVGTGLYLMVLRPPLLPEDVRFAGLDPPAVPVGLLRWLEIVFRTWGGFVLGFGVTLTGCGAFLATGRPAWLRYDVALAQSSPSASSWRATGCSSRISCGPLRCCSC